MSLVWVTNHEASSSLPQRLQPPMQFPRTRHPWHSPLVDFTMEWAITSHDGNNQQSFAVLSLKPNGQIKTWVRTTEYHLIRQSPDMIAQWSSPTKLSGTCHSCRIHEEVNPVDPHLGTRRNPRTKFYSCRTSSPHTAGQLSANGLSGATSSSDEPKVALD
jgi:hypothetical protein